MLESKSIDNKNKFVKTQNNINALNKELKKDDNLRTNYDSLQSCKVLP